jgi:hypothetical protein
MVMTMRLEGREEKAWEESIPDKDGDNRRDLEQAATRKAKPAVLLLDLQASLHSMRMTKGT